MNAISDEGARILAKLADIAQQQAVTTERLIGVLERVEDQIARLEQQRPLSIAAVRDNCAAIAKDRAAEDRKMYWWIGALVALASIIGSAMSHLFELLRPVLGH